MGVVKGQGHIVSPVSYQFASFSFHVNQTKNSWDAAISKFDLENIQGQGHEWCQMPKSHIIFSIQTKHFRFRFTSIGPNIPEIWPKQCLALKKHIRIFLRKFAKIRVSNRTFPKSNQVIAITRTIKLLHCVVMGLVVLTLSCREAYFC